MNRTLQIYVVLGIIIYFDIIFLLINKKSLDIKYTLVWIFFGFFMLIMSIFPNVMIMITKVLGIVDLTNALFLIIIFFMLVILISLTGIVSRMNLKNKQLIQEYGLLEKRVNDLERNKNKCNKEFKVYLGNHNTLK